MSRYPPLYIGSQALRTAAGGWTNFAVVTTKSPWQLARPKLPKPGPALFVDDLDRARLDNYSHQLTSFDLVVGLGSGLAMDAAKFLAKAAKLNLAQVATTSSNNACFTCTAWTFVDGERVPERGTPIPQQVIVDLDLLEKAPSRMNRAGAAEILCSHTALFDWRVGFEAGVDNQWDAELERFTRAELDVMRSFASEIGADRTEAFVRILEIGGKFADKFINYPRARFNGGSEHIFAWAFEEVTRKRLIHGEAVSLGILLMAHIEENDPDEAAKIIQTAKISFKPEHIGLTWDEVNTTATQVLGYAARVPWYTCLNEFAKRGEEGSREFMRRYIAARAFVERLS